MKILIISAVEKEFTLIRDTINNTEMEKNSLAKAYLGNYNNNEIILIETGIGTVNTAGFLSVHIERYKPDLIIQTGIGGAFKKSGLDICDIAIAKSEAYVELGLESKDLPDELPFNIFSDSEISVTNCLSMNNIIGSEAFNILENNFNVIRGNFVTVSTVTTTDKRADRIFEKYKPVLESMEGFSAALISRIHQVDFLQIRSVSNFVGERDRMSWKVDEACIECSKAVLHYINNLNL